MSHKGQHREHVGALFLAEWPQVPGPEQVAGPRVVPEPVCRSNCLAFWWGASSSLQDCLLRTATPSMPGTPPHDQAPAFRGKGA